MDIELVIAIAASGGMIGLLLGGVIGFCLGMLHRMDGE